MPTVGFNLRREVITALPPGLLTGNERCLVSELADLVSDETREGWPGFEVLARNADVPEDKVGELFARIAKKWIELRVPLGFGKDGRPYYSHPSRRMTFRFPELAVLEQLKAPQIGGPSKATQNGVPKATQNGGVKAPQNRVLSPPETGGPSPKDLPQIDPSSSSPRSPHVTFLVDRLGLDDDDDAAYLIEQIKSTHKPRSIGAYLRAMPDEDLLELLAERDRTQLPTADDLAASSGGSPQPKPKCDRCDPNRFVSIEVGNGRIVAQRCPDCYTPPTSREPTA